MIIHGDAIEELQKLEENSVESIVTDPPYGLSFMNKHWDYDVPSVELWTEAMRVLKPGGHLLSFAGSRTYHRMAVNIEDAGFEIRDQIMWVMGSGFPKSMNLYKQLQKQCKCGTMVEYEQERAKQETERGVRPLSDSDVPQTKPLKEEQGEVLQSGMSEQGAPTSLQQLSDNEGQGQPSMEGGSDLPQGEGELQRGEIREVSEEVSTDGKERRLHNGTQAGGGKTPQQDTDKDSGSSSCEPRHSRQPTGEPCAFCKQHTPQTVRRWASELYGFGTALKPAHEPIVVARKPLIGTVVDNVLEHGTGGINIDESRVETDELKKQKAKGSNGGEAYGDYNLDAEYVPNEQGRFPANFIHDGSDEVVELFPSPHGAGIKREKKEEYNHKNSIFGIGHKGGNSPRFGDSGSAARFFKCCPLDDGEHSRLIYQAKASKAERNRGLEKNNHPTVKPITLMRYLVRLVTPKGGTVLDPFMGSGTTGIACKEEGFDFIGIEREAEYIEIARARIG